MRHVGYLTSERAAEALGITAAKVRRRINAGTLSAINIGSKAHPIYRVSAEAVNREFPNEDDVYNGLWDRRHYVYRAYDTDGNCLYVGCTKQPRERRRQHESANAPWLADAVRCVMTGPLPKRDAYALESQQIRALQPTHNKPRPLPPAVIKKQQLAAASA